MNEPTLETFETKADCPNCGRKFIVNLRTTSCPYCQTKFKEEVIYQYVHDRYDAMHNNFFSKSGRALQNTGQTMQQAGDGLSSIGCGITILALIILGLLFFL